MIPIESGSREVDPMDCVRTNRSEQIADTLEFLGNVAIRDIKWSSTVSQSECCMIFASGLRSAPKRFTYSRVATDAYQLPPNCGIQPRTRIVIPRGTH